MKRSRLNLTAASTRPQKQNVPPPSAPSHRHRSEILGFMAFKMGDPIRGYIELANVQGISKKLVAPW
jgi:hypothetical protein